MGRAHGWENGWPTTLPVHSPCYPSIHRGSHLSITHQQIIIIIIPRWRRSRVKLVNNVEWKKTVFALLTFASYLSAKAHRRRKLENEVMLDETVDNAKANTRFLAHFVLWTNKGRRNSCVYCSAWMLARSQVDESLYAFSIGTKLSLQRATITLVCVLPF